MKLYLFGNVPKYAAEQALLMLFPAERPEYPEGKPVGEPRCELRLNMGEKYLTCACKLTLGGKTYSGRAAVELIRLADKDAEAHFTGRVVKLAIYRAALASGIPKPEWGCLTGVRPAKLMQGYLRSGKSPRAALGLFMREYDVSEARARLCLGAAMRAESLAATLDGRDICLYVGIPFCPTRCAYCSFVSASVERAMRLIEPYLDALYLEIEGAGRAVRDAGLRPVALYMGGGTPTTLSAGQLDALCTRLESAFDLSALREYCVEAGRPDTTTSEKLRVLRAHGVGRISVNPQSMSDAVLEAIGRRHTAGDILEALALVRECGGFAVNMDLIAGLPRDTEAGFSRTLDAVLDIAPENITVHTLAMKRGSRLMTEGGELPDAEAVGNMLAEALRRLPGAGYSPYYLYRQKYMSGGFENVGWAREGFESPYNICIMEELCGIISMGAGGSTKLTAPGRIERMFAPKYPREYIDGAGEVCAAKGRIVEFYGI